MERAGLVSDEVVKSSIHIDIDTVTEKWLPKIFRMHRVSPQLRMRKGECNNNEPSVYDPISVSLGPYHHGKQEFIRTEEFKYLCLHWCANGDDNQKDLLYGLVLNMVGEIRRAYADDSILDRYGDNFVARMMLLDACFIINFMRMSDSNEIAKDSYNCMGVALALPFAARDIMLLENQIPFFVLKALLNQVMQGPKGAQRLLAKFFTAILSVELRQAVIPDEDEIPPLHILEACRRVLIGSAQTREHFLKERRTEIFSADPPSPSSSPSSSPSPSPNQIYIRARKGGPASEENSLYAFGTHSYIKSQSVTNLNVKGIHFRPSRSHFIEDIKFTSDASFGGTLELPIFYASNLMFVYMSNMIAYEVAPGNVEDSPDFTVLSYVSFMKSLIETPADVIELQEHGILRLNRFANQEQVVQLFKSVDTFNLRNVNLYQDVMLKVGEHCDSLSKSWMADLINSKLKSPWTIIALLSAIFLLILTFLQTYYTIHS